MYKLFYALILAATATSAVAADLPSKKAALAPAPVVMPLGWAGPYVGVHAGYSTGVRSSLETHSSATGSKSIGKAECRDSEGGTVNGQGANDPTSCEFNTVPNTYTFVPSAPYASNFTASSPYTFNFVAASSSCRGASGNNQNQCQNNGGTWVTTPASCTATSGPNSGTSYPSATTSQQCGTAVGSSPNLCVISSGPNIGSYTTYTSSQQCSSFAGSSPNVCTATSGTNNGQTYTASNANQCAQAVGTQQVASGNIWVTGADLFASTAMGVATQTARENMGFAGIHAGYNFQQDEWVGGVEADFSWFRNGTEQRSSAAFAGIENVDGPGQSQVPLYVNILTSATGKFGITNFGTLRVRLGYDMGDRFLPFITGGLAYGRIVMKGNVAYEGDWGIGRGNNDPRATFSATDSFDKSGYKIGWTIGAGVNYRLTSDWVLGLTYLYVNLGTHHASSQYSYTDGLSRGNQNNNAPNNSFTVAADGSMEASLRANFHTVRLSVQYQF